MSGFGNAKATHIFSAKNIIILYIEFAKTVNEMTLNELVKLCFEQPGPGVDTEYTAKGGVWSGSVLFVN